MTDTSRALWHLGQRSSEVSELGKDGFIAFSSILKGEIMVRDFDLIRNILLEIQNHPTNERNYNLMIKGNIPTVNSHLELLIDDGFIKGKIESDNFEFSTCFSINCLTTKGHEFIDSIKLKDKWGKIKSIINDSREELTIWLIQEVAKKISLEAIGLP